MRSRIVGCLGVLALVSACATSTGTMAGSNNIAPGPSPSPSPSASPDAGARAMSPAERDSLLAQTVADREGPAVDIRAEVSWVGSSRRVRAHFNLHDDAYVLVGQIDPDGVVRVMFPTDPKDDGFARGDHSYYTDEVFAGFTDQLRYRYGIARYASGGYSPYSYDGAVGFMFVVASWRPMHFDQLSTGGQWDSFELSNDDYLRDPRPAIYELASLLAGDNREAYTVKFAQYFNTETYDYGNSFASASALFDDAFCSGLGEPIGFYTSPFNNPIFASFYYGRSFLYRGSYYQYNYAGDCYTTGIGNYLNPFANGYGFGYSPWGNPTPPRPGLFSAVGHRSPLTPHPVHTPFILPPGQTPVRGIPGRIAAEGPHFNPQYRNRGLMTSDDPSSGATRRTPGADFHHDGLVEKPSIQQMVGRHVQDDNDGLRGWMHQQRIGAENGNGGTMRQNWSHPDNANGNNGQRYRAPTSSWDAGRAQPRGGSWDGGSQVRGSSPRVESGPRPEPRYTAPPAQPRFSAPSSAPAVRSAPAPAPSSPPSAAASPSKPQN